ncbi:tetratricopeptide repeat protein [Streptomyces sp. VNUA24]|uniref:tetratricopeptide repeat protein n=1 Tax=Streptomyces sp. VNUA24 TaxID=3031131 RepID=UPI0023B7A4E6|nr:tetratricopeptide repeat protein [Streptomyces sp. VNUA24]WEH12374.1 tetratricopeptide repeat protein [Streptomyces sp. VNUA24]
MTKCARFVSLVCAGLFAGFLTSVLVLELSLRGFDSTVCTQVRLVELDSRNNLAATYRAAGNLGRAIPLYERTLEDSVRVLGEEHPPTDAVRRAHASSAIAKQAVDGPKLM